jgi:hypothetical protein
MQCLEYMHVHAYFVMEAKLTHGGTVRKEHNLNPESFEITIFYQVPII